MCVALFFLLAVLGIAVAVSRLRAPWGPGEWIEAARACGLAEFGSLGQGAFFAGRRGPLELVLRRYLPFPRPGTELIVRGLPKGIEVDRGEPGALRRLRDAGGVSIGHPQFDDAFALHGPPLALQAAFDHATRERLLRLGEDVEGGASLVALRDGAMTVHSEDGDPETRAGRLPVLLQSLLAIGERLSSAERLEDRVAQGVRDDPFPDVRLRGLTLLLEERRDHPATAAAVRAALEDTDRRVRLTAALAAGPAGRDALRALADDPAVDDALAARAIEGLALELPGGEAERILFRALALRKDAAAAACCASLGARGPAHVDGLARALAQERLVPAVAAARALGASGAPSASAPLARAVLHTDRSLRLAAVTSLGRVGSSADDVVALTQSEARYSFEGEHVRAVRQAIASIQARLAGAHRGQVSLAGADGAVSFAGDASGRLELPGGAGSADHAEE